jgi:FdhD protein
MSASIREVRAIHWQEREFQQTADHLAMEEPLEIRLGGKPVAVTMRTPGDDYELAAGFLFTEGILSRASQIGSILHCQGPAGADPKNVVDVILAEGSGGTAQGWQRNFYMTSSCGVCGKASIDAVRLAIPRLEDASTFEPDRIYPLPERLRAAQPIFTRTGALHAAAVVRPEGEIEIVREDVGRHNAVDKAVGACFLDEMLPLGGRLLLVSGRASFEIVQKALMAGIPAVAAVSGASSLAVDLANEMGMLLIGFLRGRTMQVYAGAHRLSRN